MNSVMLTHNKYKWDPTRHDFSKLHNQKSHFHVLANGELFHVRSNKFLKISSLELLHNMIIKLPGSVLFSSKMKYFSTCGSSFLTRIVRFKLSLPGLKNGGPFPGLNQVFCSQPYILI
jgi:hypothetical protein